MNTLNEKAINIFKAVVAETLLQNTYEERFLYGQLESFWNNCRQFAFGWTELAEECSLIGSTRVRLPGRLLLIERKY